MPAAFITGVTGQDGSYLAELLHSRGYDVHGLFRPGHQARADGFDSLAVSRVVHRHEGSIRDPEQVSRIVAAVKPDECYHLAAHTFIGPPASSEQDVLETNTMGTYHVLRAIHEQAPSCRVFLAGSSEMFGQVDTCPQTEETPMRPQTLYGVSKVAAYELMRYYRSARNMHASCGVLYNHESPRRGRQFVTRKITSAVARIQRGLQTELLLGNLDDRRDWGHAADYVRAMWLTVQQPEPDDYVIATGELHSVRDFLEAAFGRARLDWREYVKTDPAFYRPARAVPLAGSPLKAREKLGWIAEHGFVSLVAEMVDSDIAVQEDEKKQERTRV